MDDVLALLPRRTAGEMACVLICLAAALGFPLSWHKLALGNCLQWIGWLLNFEAAPRAFLPASKLEAMLSSLQQICATPRRVNRKELQTLVGRLVWYTTGAFWLKPWLQVWFHMLGKVRLRFQSLQREQLEDLHHCLDSECRVSHLPRLSDVQAGWKLLEIGGHAVQNRADILSAPLKRDQAWLKFGEEGSAEISLSSEELARFFMRLLQHQEDAPVHLVDLPGPCVVAAADAYADGTRAGVGGWFLPEDAELHPSNIFWFSCELEWADLPAWFTKDLRDLQSAIAALEALAQLILLSCQRSQLSLESKIGRISLRQQCDNMGVVCSTAKHLSMKQPLASVLQSTALFCLKEQVNLKISHVAGVRNEWADILSRGAMRDPSFWAQLSPSKQLSPDWLGLLNLGATMLA